MDDDKPTAWQVWLLARAIGAELLRRWFVEVPREYLRALWRWLTRIGREEPNDD